MSVVLSNSQISIQTIDSVELKLRIAGVGARAYAYAIDWHIRVIAAVVVWGLGMVIGMYLDLARKDLWIYSAIAPSLLYLFYHPVFEMLTRGSTPGKRQAKLRIVAVDGGQASTGALLVRNLFRLIDSLPVFYAIGLMTMLFTERQTRFGDLASGTLVVYDQAVGKIKLDTLLANEAISPQQALLIAELLERWKEIAPDQRRKLAHTLLERAQSLPDLKRGRSDHSDGQLHKALKDLANGRPAKSSAQKGVAEKRDAS